MITVSAVDVDVSTATVEGDCVPDGNLRFVGAKLVIVAEDAVHLDLVTHVLQVVVIGVPDEGPRSRILLEFSVEIVLR